MRKTLLIKLAAALQRTFGSSYSELYLHNDSQPGCTRGSFGEALATNMLKCCPECLGVGSRLENYLLPYLTKLDRRFRQQQLYYFNSLRNQQNLQMKFFFFYHQIAQVCYKTINENQFSIPYVFSPFKSLQQHCKVSIVHHSILDLQISCP